MTVVFLLSITVLSLLLWYQQRTSSALKAQLHSLQQTQEILITKAALKSREEERQRFARDWHDNMGNLLSTARLLTDVIETSNPQPLHQVQQLLENAHQVARNIFHNSYTSLLFSNQEVSTYLKEVQSQLQLVNIRLNYELQEIHYENWSKEKKWHFCNIIKELITNIIKHAEATQVHIRLEKYNQYIQLIVTDNGKGIDQQQIALPKTIQERVQLVQGTLRMENNMPAGTKVVIRL